MSFADDHGPGPEGDDLVAAEYVVGVLPAEERSRAAARIERDPAFARLVEEWEARLSPLAAAYPEVAAPAELKQAIDRRLFAAAQTSAPAPAPTRTGLWRSLAFWRGLAAIAVAALLLAIIVPRLERPGLPEGAQYVASLAASGSDVRYLAYYDEAAGSVALSHLSGERGQGHDYELWMIAGKSKPVSLGVVPPGQSVRLPVKPDLRDKLAGGVVVAISLEPQGGSPTGQPTGPVVAAGDLKPI